MAWIAVEPVETKGSDEESVRVGGALGRKGKKQRKRLIITLRPGVLDLDWLVAGACARVEFGAGEHVGRMRITPRGPFRLGQTGGPKTSRSPLMLCTPAPAGWVDGAAHVPAPAEFAVRDGGIEIALPEWTRGRPGEAIPPRIDDRPAEAKPALPGQRFTMLSDVYHPTTQPQRVPGARK